MVAILTSQYSFALVLACIGPLDWVYNLAFVLGPSDKKVSKNIITGKIYLFGWGCKSLERQRVRDAFQSLPDHYPYRPDGEGGGVDWLV